MYLVFYFFYFFYLISGRWMVLIDAAKGSATEPPDLSLYPADFVVMSFYKVHVFVWILLETITFGY